MEKGVVGGSVLLVRTATAVGWQTSITGGFALVAALTAHIAIRPPAVFTAARAVRR